MSLWKINQCNGTDLQYLLSQIDCLRNPTGCGLYVYMYKTIFYKYFYCAMSCVISLWEDILQKFLQSVRLLNCIHNQIFACNFFESVD